MNYLEYMQDGGGFLRFDSLKNDWFGSGSKLGRDDLKGFYEYLKRKFSRIKEDSATPSEDNSSIVVGVKDGIAYYGNAVPNGDNSHYFRINDKNRTNTLPSWIQFRS